MLLQRGPEGVWSVNNILYGNLPHQRPQLDKNLCFNLPPMLMNTTFSERFYISVSTCYPDLQIVYGTYFQVHCAIGKLWFLDDRSELSKRYLKWKSLFICFFFLSTISASIKTLHRELSFLMKLFENTLYVRFNFVVSNAFYHVGFASASYCNEIEFTQNKFWLLHATFSFMEKLRYKKVKKSVFYVRKRSKAALIALFIRKKSSMALINLCSNVCNDLGNIFIASSP